jgi:predicted esterase
VRTLTLVIVLLILSPVYGAEVPFGPLKVTPGQKIEFLAPVNPLDKLEVHKEGNAPVENARGALILPEGFHFKTNTYLLIINTTSDGAGLNIPAMSAYTNVALTNGWMVLAADGAQGKPKFDHRIWRATMLKSTLRYVRKNWPASTNWTVCFAGFSGGAKWSGLLAPAIMKDGWRVGGVFMGGCNEDRPSDGYTVFKPGAEFLRTKLFLSNGSQDQLAGLDWQKSVQQSLQRTGFQNVRLAKFDGGHELSQKHLRQALRWFAGWPDPIEPDAALGE